MRELELIESLRIALSRGGPRVIRWLGDDAAVVRARPYAVTSLDTMVEGVHFRRRDLRPEEIGHRAIAAALSDLAAMAADPGEAYLSLAVPEGTELEDALGDRARGAGGGRAPRGDDRRRRRDRGRSLDRVGDRGRLGR